MSLPPEGTIRIILDDLTVGDVHERFGTGINGRHLQATDLDWSYGSGPVLRGKAEAIALVLCGRTVPAGRIEGTPL
jgi:hypothetical protein